MKTKTAYFLLISVICFGIGFSYSSSVSAEEIGQVQTNAGVGFYESSTDSSSTQSTTKTSTTKNPDTVTKPKGRYPSTGELVRQSITISGIILIFLAILLILWKRKKNQQTRNGKEE
ncbi:hypothetical protein A5881_002103 [Enterococcus termitis]|nr:hypothetical protein A5881_001576 [Enterococcus termitis]